MGHRGEEISLKLKLFLFILISINTFAHAGVEEFSIQNHKLKLDVPREWLTRTDMLGLPLAIVSPLQADNNRVVISLAQASQGDEKVLLGESFIEASSKEFQGNKKQWLEKNKGHLVEFIPNEIISLGKGHRALVLGYIYDLNGKRNTEKSYYIECGGRIYFGKILVNKTNEALMPLAHKTLESLQCL